VNLPHTVTIERATKGSLDDRGVAAQTWATLVTVAAWVQPKSARELAQLSQGGPVAATHTVYLWPSDITAGDRFVWEGTTYQLDGIRDAAGIAHHLECDAHTVEVP